MDGRVRQFAEKRAGVAILTGGHFLLSAVMFVALLAFGLPRSFWWSIGLGVGMTLLGGVTSGMLTHFTQKLGWLWVASYSVLPFMYVIPSYRRYVNLGDTIPLLFWTTFPLGVLCACYIGAAMGKHFEIWNRMHKPLRGKFVRRLKRWIS